MSKRLTMTGVAVVLSLALACSRQSATPSSPSAANAASSEAAADGSTLKVTAPVPTSPVNDQALNESPTLVAGAVATKFGSPAPGPLVYRFQVFNDAGAVVVDSGPQASPTYRVGGALDFKKRHTWRVRAELGNDSGPWSSAASFISSEGGYLRGNELLDPLFNGATVGQIVGPTTFLPGKGIRLDTNLSYVRYVMPQTVTAGEFSMEVEGLRANAPGDKSKVFAMSTNGADFITDPYRVDVQYRGTAGFPPNSITYRVLYGSADDLSVRYEPDTGTRLSSIYNLSPTQTYYWKYTWGNGQVRVVMREGGANDNGRVLYDVARNATRGSYSPNPHYAFLGAPTGRSGSEAASIPGTIYRNVWLGARPRP